MTSSIQQQRGVALVVSLIILISLTMLGLTAIQRTTTDLSMAGNHRETGLMFQAAEVGLVTAENFIDDSTTNVDFDDPDRGLHTITPGTDWGYSNYFDETMWTSNAMEAETSLKAYEQPRFIVEYLGNRSQNPLASVNIGGGYGSQQTGEIVSIYRSTARGVGLTGNSARLVQSYFGKEAP